MRKKRNIYLKVKCSSLLYCPHCGVKLYGVEDEPFSGICPHVVFIYYWGDPDLFVYVRKDFGAKFIKALKSSANYKEMIAEGELEPITEAEEAIFLSEQILKYVNESGDKITEETQNKLTRQKDFEGLCGENTVIYTLIWGVGYSGFNIAIDLGNKDIEL